MRSLFTRFEIPAGPPLSDDEWNLGPSAELTEFKPPLLSPSEVIGRRVDLITTCAGTYGMGGPGFFGLRLCEDWLIIAIWNASEWLQMDGRRVHDTFSGVNGSPRPWISEAGDELSPLIVGHTIKAIEIARTTMAVTFDNDLVLRIDEDSRSRPVFHGSGQPRAFALDDDLRKSVFLSPTPELWV